MELKRENDELKRKNYELTRENDELKKICLQEKNDEIKAKPEEKFEKYKNSVDQVQDHEEFSQDHNEQNNGFKNAKHESPQEQCQPIEKDKQIITEFFFVKHNKPSALIELLEKPKDLSKLYDYANKCFKNHIHLTLQKIYRHSECFLLDIQKLNQQIRYDFIVLKGGVFWLII
jgi:hypothetical protein